MKPTLQQIILASFLGAATCSAAETPATALLVLNKGDNTLAIVDPVAAKVVARVPSGPEPHEVVAAKGLAFISNYGGNNTLSVVDLSSQKALAPINLGALRSPHGLWVAEGKVYFTAEANKIIGRYDPAAQQIDWLLGLGQERTHMIVVSPDAKRIFTSNVNSDTISLIEAGSGPGGPGGGPGSFGPPGQGGPGGPPPDGLPRMVKPVEWVHPQAVTTGAKSCLGAYALVQFAPMNWKRMLAYVTGSVDEELLAQNEYLIAKKFDGSKNRSPGAGGSTSDKIEELILQLARENRTWGYRRIAGALSNLGHEVSHQTVANVLKQHDVAPAPERGRTMSWGEFIRSHVEVLAAVDFFTAEVWTAGGLITFYVLSCMRVASRQVCIVGITTSPDQRWIEQMARNLSFADTGFLNGCRYLLHDRDAKFSVAFTGILEAVGIQAVKLPARSPNLNANLERWHRSVKEECLSKMILFGEASLRQVLSNYVLHYHGERNHQGKGSVILFPRPEDRIGESTGEIQTRERLGGVLKFYYRKAA